MATAQPQIIVIDGGSKSTPLEKIQTLALIGGLGLGGYVVYELFFSGKDPCNEDYLFGSQGLLGQFTLFNPACEFKSVLGFFGGLVDIGVGVPVQLEECPAGWTNDGLTCREPITCGEGWDFFSEGCSGGNVVGRLNNGGTCPADHPEKIDGLCYKTCPEGYVHTEGMPYTCRKSGNDFFSAITSGFQLPSFLS